MGRRSVRTGTDVGALAWTNEPVLDATIEATRDEHRTSDRVLMHRIRGGAVQVDVAPHLPVEAGAVKLPSPEDS